ncbi:hypothetical protein TARUN_7862 [Trichoderma arundinaceum]|uniref:Uncharacterized protein n=1 Tax=Trichoderma arundinaceum TaxID=490622 RepID=A0A395NEX8_TRIAR|nr:hypothetical protein TARUN_7862 [Trichoderma arundinaceum]
MVLTYGNSLEPGRSAGVVQPELRRALRPVGEDGVSGRELAVAGFETAVVHQTKAIRALQAAIETAVPAECMQLMAASMLLNIYETLNFETSDLSWSIFFCGTKRIANLVTKTDDTYFGDEALIIDWIFYHDVMYKFSIRHWREKNRDQIQLAAQRKVLSKAVFSPERQIIVPILGCSLELLDLLCQAIDAVYEPGDDNYQSESHLKVLRSLEIRLKYLDQRQSTVAPLEDHEATQQVKVAELFRLASTIYLLRMAKGEPENSKGVVGVINQAFELLNQIEHCERPWPLFIIALEARTEEHRMRVLRVLKKSLERRPLGPLTLVNKMIPDAWTQQDLRESAMDPFTLYGMIISRNRVPPCFT